MKKTICVLLLFIFLFPFLKAQNDIPGSKDHPLITRYPGSYIAYYEEQQFDEYSIATGPQTGYKKIDKWLPVEGKFTRIYYVVKGEVTITEVYRNYLSAIEKAGFKILAKGINADRNVSQEVGGVTFLKTFYETNPFPVNKNINITNGSATSGGSCYLAAELEKADGKVYLALGGSQYATDEKVFLLDIIEQTAMEDDLIKVTADEMLKGIKAQGKIALYGIYFDTDKVDIKPESESTLQEIANLLKKDPKLNIFVVGHTDITGGYEHNMDLSKRRAASVVKELTTKYGINSSRLTPDGVGPLSPIATNETEDGKKLNRRVELVAK
ncbi:MAG TPA: OmpA family protein [Ignavibacteriaceae bacterium]|nr:OmpA family protein [Ignavibacteriaceae bacterium]